MNKFLKKGIFLFMIFLGSAVLVGCSTTSENDSKDSKKSASKECFSIGKEVTGNTDLKAVLGYVEDNSDATKKTFTMKEIEGMNYGMLGENGDSEYYGTYELCNLDTGEYLEPGEYVFEEYTLFEVQSNPNAIGEASGNQTNFIYTVEGEERNEIPGPGKYAVSTFSASEVDGEWELADSIEFTVTK